MQQAKPDNSAETDQSYKEAVASDLQILQKLISQLNNSLLKLTVDRGQYKNQVNACSGLCKEIKELMHVTTQRVTADKQRQPCDTD